MENFEAQNFVLSRKSLDSNKENCKSNASNALNGGKGNSKKGSKHVAFSKYMNVLFVALLYVFLQNKGKYDGSVISKSQCGSEFSRKLGESFFKKLRKAHKSDEGEYYDMYNEGTNSRRYYEQNNVQYPRNMFEAAYMMNGDKRSSTNNKKKGMNYDNGYDNYNDQNEEFYNYGNDLSEDMNEQFSRKYGDDQYYKKKKKKFDARYDDSCNDPYANFSDDGRNKHVKVQKYHEEDRSSIRNQKNKRSYDDGMHYENTHNGRNAISNGEYKHASNNSENRESASDENIKKLIDRLDSDVHCTDMLKLFYLVNLCERRKFFNTVENALLYWEDVSYEYELPEDYKYKQWGKVYCSMSDEMKEVEEETFKKFHFMQQGGWKSKSTFTNFLKEVKYIWYKMMNEVETKWKEYLLIKAKKYNK
ncbi:Plasmodium exported protein (PHIST), unknown function [Plasmodium ovale wallikeri]|uniref:Plasmodium RESA N-terminal domain-containing protein n=2 Tax=Plasmodium ovale TaxID=36330 RepID=A0A1A9ADW0_PLAOA|nr:Plasmodium exported protein (PHIST), unknown function [Plasmodium ovale wallikeri]SBT55399.1 Plasmodium exported protein (PHIST), unknown function [Plasmodium ovale wallikeri]SBT73176.1 Plasmodium exported protein (PHIST), unknown function [Plasmodium ovale]